MFDIMKAKCYNCEKKGHLARDCEEKEGLKKRSSNCRWWGNRPLKRKDTESKSSKKKDKAHRVEDSGSESDSSYAGSEDSAVHLYEEFE